MSGTTAAAQSAESPEKVRGSLVIAGGGLKPETAEVWRRIVALAGGKGAPIAVFGSASEDPIQSAQSAIKILNQYGARAFFVPVAVELKNSDYRQAAADARNVAAVEAARGVYFTGGDQGRTTRALLDDQGQRTPVLEAIWKVYRRGGVIAGSSAGAAIMSTTMFYEPAGILELLQRGVLPSKDIAPGLGFVGPKLFVDQHVLVRGRFARMLPAMLASGYRTGLGIDENTAAVVTQGHRIEIVGKSGAVLVNLADATSSGKALNVKNVRISLLGPEDTYDLESGKVEVAPAKLKAGAIDFKAANFRPANTDHRNYADVLGRSVLVELMTDLIDNQETEAIGLAFDIDAATAPNRGFEFRFYKGPGTIGYASSSPALNGYTVLDMRLDVTPVEFGVPLYRRADG